MNANAIEKGLNAVFKPFFEWQTNLVNKQTLCLGIVSLDF